MHGTTYRYTTVNDSSGLRIAIPVRKPLLRWVKSGVMAFTADDDCHFGSIKVSWSLGTDASEGFEKFGVLYAKSKSLTKS
ncbi:MAG TPA: hypothetical protein VGO47_09040 [Chlamydiales bacterium]|nr:hypothetical protein [Chlamydiales bacterium]